MAKDGCEHKQLMPVGQNVVPIGSELLVVVSAFCVDCGELLVKTASVKHKGLSNLTPQLVHLPTPPIVK